MFVESIILNLLLLEFFHNKISLKNYLKQAEKRNKKCQSKATWPDQSQSVMKKIVKQMT